MNTINSNIIKWIALILGCVLTACVSSSKPSSAEVPQDWTHYTFELGETVTQKHPLPSVAPVYVIWHNASDKSLRKPAFLAWDLNKDGQFDCIEALTREGQTQKMSCDFDFDGVLDD